MAGEEVEQAAAAATQSPSNHKEPQGDERRGSSSVPHRYICSFPDCNATFNKGWKLEAHLCKHTGERPFVCDYEGCGKSFTRDFHLRRHCLIHTGEKQFVCTVDGCDKKYATKQNLNKHMGKHSNRLYVCDFENCGKSFKKHQQLKIHQCQHTGELFFRCSHQGCEARFAIPHQLKRHEKTHEGYMCRKDGCSFIGKTWSQLRKHTITAHIEPVVCSVCAKTFTRKDYLRCHQKIHASEREVFRCPRESCGRTYTTLFNLQSHIVSFHEEKRPFSCDHPGCGKVFSMKQSLVRHAVVHDPEKKKRNLNKQRPKRSLASRLSGYIPPKAKQRRGLAMEETLTAQNNLKNSLPAVETLCLD
ncbi:UNVERIFIED_CONTAM: Transcription factor IIIA [Gekko kuhli]